MDRDSAHRLAHLARIELSDSELDQLTHQLDAILTSFEKLSELDTDDVEPMIHAVDVKNVFRETSLPSELTREEALSNAPSVDDPFFRVPRTFQERGTGASPGTPETESETETETEER